MFRPLLVAVALGFVVFSVAGCIDSPVPDIRVHPADQSVVEPQAATFSVQVSGAKSLKWQEQREGTGFTDIPGATSATLTLDPTELGMNGRKYRLVAINDKGVSFSNAATLTVTADNAPGPRIVTQPQNASVASGATAMFSVVATGTDPLTYQWQRLDNGEWRSITVATAAEYTTNPVVQTDHGAQFRVIVSDVEGSVTSSAATLSVTGGPSAPSVITHPANASVGLEATPTFTVVAAGDPAPVYEWQIDVDGNNNWTVIPGADQASYTTPPTMLADNGSRFRVILYNVHGTAASNPATLTVSVGPLDNIAQLSVGYRHALGLKFDGSVWAWGTNFRGQVGRATPGDHPIPGPIDGLTGTFVAVYAGNATSFAIRNDGTVWAWGDNMHGQLGNPSVAVGAFSSTAVQVLRASDGQPLTGVVGLTMSSTSYASVLAWTAAGVGWSWGSTYVEPGDMNGFSPANPVRQRAVPNIYFDATTPARTLKRAALANLSAVAIVGDDTTVYWNRFEHGDTTGVTQALDATEKAIAIAAGAGVHFIVRMDNTLWVQGTGRTGIGINADVWTQVPVGAPVDNVAVVLTGDTVHCTSTTRQLYTWGSNELGQLGDGTTTSRNSPAPALLTADVVGLGPGHGHGLAVRMGGAVWGWGNNEYGTLGTTGTQTPTPYALTGR